MMSRVAMSRHLREAHDVSQAAPLALGDVYSIHARMHASDRAWSHYHPIFTGAASGEEFLEDPQPRPRPATPAARFIQVVWHDGHWERFTVESNRPWKLSYRRTLVIGRGVPRVEIPLDTVRWYSIGEEDGK